MARMSRGAGRARDERGFTFIELMMVCVIIGVLAAIALPAFADQREKGGDAATKSLVRNGVSALGAYYVLHETYALTEAELIDEEPVLRGAHDLDYRGDTNSFQISAQTSDGERRFGIEKVAGGPVRHFCAPAGEGSCRPDGSW